MPNILPNKNPLSYLGVRPETPADTILATAAPTINDREYQIGTRWLDQSTGSLYYLSSITSGSAIWLILSGPNGALVQLDGDTGSAVPTDGAISIAGGANIDTSATGSTLTVDLVADVATNSLEATGGNVIISNVGSGLSIAEGSNARMGQATLVAGTVTIANTSVTAATRIFVSRTDINSSTGLGTLEGGTITPATSFVINSYNSTAAIETNDVSIVNWFLVEAV